ncbi:MAG: U32 family peptidase [Paludibacteraceae bacterium]|nr:U32 family peptidase [Paludibacteraceae bacterium]
MCYVKEVELLAPAKNYEIGIEAVKHGADAVYIGAERFGARAAAGNSVEDIARLVAFAHKYCARVFVTVNTLMDERERLEARELIVRLYEVGVDAVIIQDTRLTLMDLPPIELHASTQCDIRTKERVEELRKLGFTQMVLARELSIKEIVDIARSTDAVIECFVHGALCVCYSGRCFMSEAVTGRSANRGECTQMCRLPYDLEREDGRSIIKGRYLLSLKDFDATMRIGEMLDAGVRCFKIEGRLKDMNYVKNITAWYRKRLDEMMEGKGLRKRSLGDVRLMFEPDVRRTFYRGGTEYFLSGERRNGMCTMVTGKAMGEPLGDGVKLKNGDGVCWVDEKSGELKGVMVDGNERLPRGVQLFRNNDIEFERVLRGESAERKIGVTIKVEEKYNGFRLTGEVKGYGTKNVDFQCDKSEAKDAGKTMEVWRKTLAKTGGTEFRVDDVVLDFGKPWFVPVSKIAEMRRALIETLSEGWGRVTNRCDVVAQKACNVAEYGVIPEELMRCRYCIRYEIGECLKKKGVYRGELFLRNSKGRRFKLGFDCEKCEMIVNNQKQ